MPSPFVDSEPAEYILRHKVMLFLKDDGLLSEEGAELLLSWRRSGFSVHNNETASAADQGGLERLARYLMQPPLSLERLHLDDNAQSETYSVKMSASAQHAGSEVLETGAELACLMRNAREAMAASSPPWTRRDARRETGTDSLLSERCFEREIGSATSLTRLVPVG